MGKTRLRISIIVLTYKRFDNLNRNIESILKQTYEEYEVIISDDGSPNFNREYIESHYKGRNSEHKFSIIARKNNVGTVKNFNEAVKSSIGDIIVPLSQDDFFCDENALAKIANAFCDSGVNVCLGLRVLQGTDYTLPSSTHIKIMQDGDRKKLWFRNACGNLYFGAALYYRKDYLQKVGFFDEQYTLLEDYPFVMNCLEKGERIYLINAPTICYSMDGVSGRNKGTITPKTMRNDFFRMYRRNYLSSKEKINSRVCKDYLLFRMRTRDESCSRFKRYSNLVIDIILVLAFFHARFAKKHVIDSRFAILWEFEELATKMNTISGRSAGTITD